MRGHVLTVAAPVLAGAGAAYIIGLDQWFVEAVPEHLRGRAMPLLTTGLMTAQGLGTALAGVAAELFPVHQVVAWCGVTGTACTLVLIAQVHGTHVRYRSARQG